MIFFIAPLGLFILGWLFTGSVGKAFFIALMGELLLVLVMLWAWHTVDLAFRCAVSP